MRKRIEALLLGKLERVTPGLPCGGGISTASPAYPPPRRTNGGRMRR